MHVTAVDGAERWILHLDMDAFYAAIEQRDRPDLRGRPVVVGGSPQSRGVVCSASYEARVHGVRSAMPCSQAARRCPEAIFVCPDFSRYSAASRTIFALMREVTPLVEPLSLDEAFLDVSAAVARGGDPVDLAVALRREIRERTGLTVSAGVAPNKFLAKIASDRNKPDGLCVIVPDAIPDLLTDLPVTAVPGIGPVTAARCRDHGIHVVGDFLRVSDDRMLAWFGSQAAWFAACARGQDDRPVDPEQERRSIGIEDTFADDLSDLAAIDDRLVALADGLTERMRRSHVRGGSVVLKVKYGDFRLVTRSRTLRAPIGEADELLRIARALLPETDAGRIPVRLLGISCGRLDASGGRQEVLGF